MNSTVTLTPADKTHFDLLLGYARAFHAEDGHPLTAQAEQALQTLLATPLAGQVFIICQTGEPVGYGVLCFGFSIEFGGRDCFIDDLYVVPAARGQGTGTAALSLLVESARTLGCMAVHLEVMKDNPRAAHLYERNGFANRGSTLMSLTIKGGHL